MMNRDHLMSLKSVSLTQSITYSYQKELTITTRCIVVYLMGQSKPLLSIVSYKWQLPVIARNHL